MKTSIQQYIDTKFTDSVIREEMIRYSTNSAHRKDIESVIFLMNSKIVRAEFYINVAAGCLISVRRMFVGGHEHDGPMYGYALSVGVKAENLKGVIEFMRSKSLDEVRNYLVGGAQ